MKPFAFLHRPSVLSLVGGAALLAAGLWMAVGTLPIWSLGEIADRSDLVRSFRQLARQIDAVLESGEPVVALTSRQALDDPRAKRPRFGSYPGTVRDEVVVTVSHRAVRGDGSTAELLVGFHPLGEPVLFSWSPLDSSALVSGVRLGPGSQQEARAFASLLVPAGRELGESVTVAGFGAATVLFPLEGEGPPGHVEILDPTGAAITGFRRAGTVEEAQRAGSVLDLGRALLSEIPGLLIFLAVVGLFLSFLGRRRIDLVNAALLSGLAFAVLSLSSLPWNRGLLHAVSGITATVATAVWIFLLWSTGESWLRSLEPQFTTTFDALRTGRLGPRGGRAILGGLGVGAGLAGLRLALMAGAERLPAVTPAGLSVPLPIFGTGASALTEGILLAAMVLLSAVLGLRFLPRRWALPVAAVASASLARPVLLEPGWVGLAAGTLLTGVLLAVFRRLELTGLLVAAVGMLALPALIFSGSHLEWIPGTFALTAGGTLILATVAFTALRRPEEEEARGMTAPAFVRRLAEERRLQHEMGLLARMQLGLLPQEEPHIDGWEISARSVLATEVGGDLYDFVRDEQGGLWIAAGDVSGHGYSCAVVHAMTKAALTSLISAQRTPALVLSEVDRVLRSVRFERAFTSLVLLRLDLATGEGVLANAGHPYPLICTEGRVEEIEVPGLPLGQGPAREYVDRTLGMDPGGVLVFCSDGLFESTDRETRAYGFERPRALLERASRWPSNEILEMLLGDWRRHRGPMAALDDTTVVVIKRLHPEEMEAVEVRP